VVYEPDLLSILEDAELLQLMLLACPDGIVFADSEEKVVLYAGASEKIFGYAPVEVLGHSAWNLFYHDEGYAALRDRLRTEVSVANEEVLGVRRGGLTFDLAVSVAQLRDRYGEQIATVIYCRDHTHVRAIENALRENNERLNDLVSRLDHVARHDALTGLLNRASALEHAEQALLNCTRAGKPFGVAVFDLDRFKNVNDTYGHLVGDEVLATLSHVLSGSTRGGDLIGRFGGEEFVAFVPGADRQGIITFAERVRQAVADASVPIGDGRAITITISAGVATIPASAVTIQEAIRVADDRLLLAKRSGRNRVVSEDEPRERTVAA
jgi:diguanylate cyclase (GGDEF)-like protein/PAS domain S-box-containing protein